MRQARTSPIDVAYIWLRYFRKHGRPPRFFRPARSTEKIQWRKLFDFDPRHTIVSDKLAMRAFVAERVGAEVLVPLLWIGDDPEAIPFDSFTEPYVLKCTHGNAMNVFVDDPSGIDEDIVRAELRLWLARDHGKALVESGHRSIRPRIMAEPMLREEDGSLPVEYKYLMFDGETFLIGVRTNAHHHGHTTLQMRPDWTPVPLRFDAPIEMESPPACPQALDRMTTIAGVLAADFDHIRVDFLLSRGNAYVGELTLYPHSGMVPLQPDEFDLRMGELWTIEEPAERAFSALLGRQ